MIRFILGILLSVSGSLCLSAYANAPKNHDLTAKHKYRVGVILVRYDSSTVALPSFKLFIDRRGIGQVGIPSLDLIHQRAHVLSISKDPFYQPKDSKLAKQIGSDRVFIVRVPDSTDVVALAKQYAADPNVEYATPDWTLTPTEGPNDSLYSKQWGHKNTAQMPSFNWNTGQHNGPLVGTVGFDAHAEAAWGNLQGYGDTNIVIAIIDDGVEYGHPDLAANIWTNPGEMGVDAQGNDKRTNGIDDDGNGFVDDWHGWDFGCNDNDPNPDSASPGHGTACAGIAAAVANNGLGVAGIAGACKIMALKVADSEGTMYYSTVEDAIYYAADMGAKVISISLGGTQSDLLMQSACEYAWDAGVVLCAATGNENMSSILYPAALENVLAIGAASNCGDRKRSSSNSSDLDSGVVADPLGYTCDGERWWGSNYGSATQDAADAVDVIAPTILPTTDRVGANGYDKGDYYLYFNGTSCATAYAAGVCALIFSKHPTWSPSEVRNQLCLTAQDIVNAESRVGWDRYTGYGMVDAAAATGSVLVDTAAPVISALQVDSIRTDSAIIAWTTDEQSSTVVEYGLTTNYGQKLTDTSGVTSHQAILTDLMADTLYHFHVASLDREGNKAASPDHWFRTGGAFSYSPSAVTIVADSIVSGNYADLAANDAQYLVVQSTKSGTRYCDWYGSVTISQEPSAVSKLTVTYDGKYSRSRTQYLYLYNWSTSAWQQIDSRTVSTSEVTVTDTQTWPADFLSGTGEIRLRVYTSGGTVNYTCSGDLMLFAVETAGSGFTSGTVVSVQPIAGESNPSEFLLRGNFPNPFNPITTIRYELADNAIVNLAVFDILGRTVATLVNYEQQHPGVHDVRFDASSLASGIYLCRWIARTSAGESFVQTKKLMLLR